VPVGGSIPRWKQRTKGQWLAWIATRLRWVLNAFYVTLFLTYHSPVRRRGLTFRSREWRRLNREFAPAARFSDSGASFILSFRIRDCKVVSRGSLSSTHSFILDAARASFNWEGTMSRISRLSIVTSSAIALLGATALSSPDHALSGAFSHAC
jgi:hypothetical protein